MNRLFAAGFAAVMLLPALAIAKEAPAAAPAAVPAAAAAPAPAAKPPEKTPPTPEQILAGIPPACRSNGVGLSIHGVSITQMQCENALLMQRFVALGHQLSDLQVQIALMKDGEAAQNMISAAKKAQAEISAKAAAAAKKAAAEKVAADKAAAAKTAQPAKPAPRVAKAPKK